MATTLQNLIDQVRSRSDMENNQFVTDTELTSYINNSLASLDDILIGTYDDYRVSTFQSVLSGTNATIPIPSNFYKLRAVDFNSGQGQVNWQTIYSFQLPERNRSQNNLNTIVNPYINNDLSYRLSDAGIIIMPAERAAGTYQIWYVPKFIALADTDDTLTIQMDTQAWVEYSIVDVCIKILNKQNLDPSGFMAEKAELKQRIVSAAKNRNSAGPKRVANVRFQSSDYDQSFYNGDGNF